MGAEDRNLYNGCPYIGGWRFVVDVAEQGGNYDLWIGGSRRRGYHVCLSEKYFKRMASSDVNSVMHALGFLTQGKANSHMREWRIDGAELTLALQRARIEELEKALALISSCEVSEGPEIDDTFFNIISSSLSSRPT